MELCCQANGAFCCICVFPGLRCCGEHEEVHKQRPGLHFFVPWSEAPETEFEQLQLQGWLYQLQHGSQLFSLSLSHLSSLSTQVETRYQALLLKLLAQKNRCIGNIQRMKEKFEEMLQQCKEESRLHRLEPAYKPQGSLTKLLWTHMPSTAKRRFQVDLIPARVAVLCLRQKIW